VLPFVAIPYNDAGIVANSPTLYIMSNAIADYWPLTIPLFIIAFLCFPRNKRDATLSR